MSAFELERSVVCPVSCSWKVLVWRICYGIILELYTLTFFSSCSLFYSTAFHAFICFLFALLFYFLFLTHFFYQPFLHFLPYSTLFISSSYPSYYTAFDTLIFLYSYFPGFYHTFLLFFKLQWKLFCSIYSSLSLFPILVFHLIII